MASEVETMGRQVWLQRRVGGGVNEEARDVVQVADVNVVHDAVPIVEVEAVMEMIEVGGENRD